jgi:hypothetical protein
MCIIEEVIKTLSRIALIFLIVMALHFAFGGSDPFGPRPVEVTSPIIK